MKVYGVVLDEATEENLEVGKRIGQKYPDHYRLNETFYLIKTSYDNSSDVAHVIGIRGGDLRERVVAIETEIKHLATKEDFQKLKVWVLSGVIGGMAIAAGLAVAILKLLTN